MTWIRADEAAAALNVTLTNVHVIAHREQWRRIKAGKDVGYDLDDVADTAARRAERTGVMTNHNGVSSDIKDGDAQLPAVQQARRTPASASTLPGHDRLSRSR